MYRFLPQKNAAKFASSDTYEICWLRQPRLLFKAHEGSIEVPGEFITVVDHNLTPHDVNALSTDQVLSTKSPQKRQHFGKGQHIQKMASTTPTTTPHPLFFGGFFFEIPIFTFTDSRVLGFVNHGCWFHHPRSG